MAYRVTQRIISSDDLLYPYFDDLCRKSKLLYNAALFRVRNIFTGYDKEHRTENEVEVFQEVALLQRSYPNMHVRRVISYTHLEKMMRVTENPDFFSGLPRQTAQQMVKQTVTDFKNWLASLREYKKHPEKYLGKPKMPRYKKSDLTTVIITNQDAVLYRDVLKTAFAKATLVLFKSFFGSCIKRSQDQTVLWSFFTLSDTGRTRCCI